MKKILFGFMMSALLAGCSNDDMPDVGGVDTMADTPVAFNVGVADATTRAGYPAGELTSGTLGFCMQTAGTDAMEQSTKDKYNGTNRKVEYVSGKWQIDGYPLLWRNATAEVSWQAYYPYSESNVTDGILTVTIPADQQNDGVYDLLYGKGTTDGMTSFSGIDITLKHRLSKFIVNIAVGTELSDAEIESVVLSDMCTEYELNLLTGYWSQTGVSGHTNVNMIKHEDGKTFEAVLIPHTPTLLNIDITLKGGRRFFYKQGLPTFEEGMIHSLNLRMGKDKVELAEGGITVGEWKYENGGNDDFRTE